MTPRRQGLPIATVTPEAATKCMVCNLGVGAQAVTCGGLHSTLVAQAEKADAHHCLKAPQVILRPGQTAQLSQDEHADVSVAMFVTGSIPSSDSTSGRSRSCDHSNWLKMGRSRRSQGLT